MELQPLAVAAAVRLIERDVVGSTNAEAFAQAREGERGPLWIIAREQTAGRGRRGRSWISAPGNLHASILLTAACPPGRAAELSFVGALALHDAVATLDARIGPRLRFKWPNDLLLDGAKLAGILVEGETLPDGRFATVLGFGLNCAHHPGDTPYPACDLAGAGFRVEPAQVLAPLSRTLMARLAEWNAGDDFAAIREAWLARAMGVGEPIRVRAPGSDLEGRFLALDEAGRLVLALPEGGTRIVSTAEVFPLSAPLPQAPCQGDSA